jgi:ABC-type multidrug transport system ATPase subunit
MLEIVELLVGRRTGPVLLGPVTLGVRPGEVVELAGPSGCGKTLLLQCLCGRAPQRSGEVRWQGRALPLAKRRDPRVVAYLGDEGRLAPAGLGVRRCLELAASLVGQPRQRVDELCSLFGLADVGATPVDGLPSGLEERLRLALLELPRPSLVLLDHPLAHLDEQGEEGLQLWLDRVRERQACVIRVRAGAERAARSADRVALLAPGGGIERIVLRGEA